MFDESKKAIGWYLEENKKWLENADSGEYIEFYNKNCLNVEEFVERSFISAQCSF